MLHEVPLRLRRGGHLAVDLDVEAVSVEAVVGAVGGKVDGGANQAEGSRYKSVFLAVMRQMFAERR